MTRPPGGRNVQVTSMLLCDIESDAYPIRTRPVDDARPEVPAHEFSCVAAVDGVPIDAEKALERAVDPSHPLLPVDQEYALGEGIENGWACERPG